MTDLFRLLDRLEPPQDGESPVRHRTGTVDAVNSDGTVDLDLGGVVVDSVAVLAGAFIAVGATVQVAVWRGDLLVLGAVRTANQGGPLGVLGYAQVTSSQGGLGVGRNDLNGLAVTVDVGTSRRIRISGSVQLLKQTNPGRGELIFREGSTSLGRGWRLTDMATSGVARRFRGYGATVITPSAGSHTYKLTIDLGTAGGTAEAAAGGEQNWILVEDLGSA